MNINKTSSNEEVDLGQLFNMIGNTFNKFFQFIGSIFSYLFMAFVWLIFFIRRRLIILITAAATGIVIGYVFEKTSPPVYKSSISVKQNYQTGENLYGSINYYNGLLKDRDYVVLSKVLGLKSSPKEIVGFDIEPIITDNDMLVLFDRYMSELDSLAASKIDFEDFSKNIKNYKHRYQQISIKSRTRVDFNKVFTNIVENIKSNSFFVNEQSKDLAELKASKLALKEALIKSDSLQQTYKRVLEQQIDQKATSEIGITFEGNNEKDKTREFDLYKNDIDLRDRIVVIERELKDKENIIDVISSKQDNGFVDHTKDFVGLKLPFKQFYLAFVFSIVFIGLLSFEFLKFLEKYKPYK
tara:strand:- start:320 stop:1384 length:1065 start_codon:yes stop_codon:yes gene_type:complete